MATEFFRVKAISLPYSRFQLPGQCRANPRLPGMLGKSDGGRGGMDFANRWVRGREKEGWEDSRAPILSNSLIWFAKL